MYKHVAEENKLVIFPSLGYNNNYGVVVHFEFTNLQVYYRCIITLCIVEN